ncbi:ankyrin repeat domain-containing protein SOWAHC isoform X3 [Polyodon spathula]|uniref:ankyrin repeat domain-containing protein SOWAHC isoform X3 n=1 Tax=Polyodon spathula TaxID=7913 RepID=UPI001B7E52A2|nr:ankyrin repeat domain-containing protein SOWAHC isoform X3 [Polyodon spathula]
MEELSEEALLEYISAAGGRVKNSDLLRDFKHFINHSDKNVRAKHREDFKQIIDKIALVKTDNGEKFLTLKKKYKQLLPEREREPGSDGERASVPRQGGMVMWEGGEVSTGLSPQVQPSLEPSTPTEATQDLKTNSPDRRDKGRSAAQNRAVCSWSGGPAIIVTVCSDPPTQVCGISEPVFFQSSSASRRRIDLNPSVVWEEPSPQEGPQEQEQPESPRQAARGCASAPQVEDPLAQSPKEDEQDAVSKSETEQDEDGTGSMGSSAIALDPLEKEWIHSAACGRLPVLNHLLQQDPTLVYKKDFTSGFRCTGQPSMVKKTWPPCWWMQGWMSIPEHMVTPHCTLQLCTTTGTSLIF